MAFSPAHRRTLPTVLLLVATASWGGNWVAARAVVFDVPPFALSFWRWAIASLILLPFAAAQLREDAPIIRRHLPALAAFGVIGVAVFTTLGYWGLRYTTAVNATLLNSSLPVFVVPLSWWLLRLTVSGRQLAGLALSLAGVACVVSAGELRTLAQLALNPGDLLVLCGTLLWAIYTVLLKWRPPVQPLSFLFGIAATAAAFLLPLYLWESAAGGAIVASAKTIAAIGYLALFPSIIAYICWNRAVAEVGPNVAGFFQPAIPLFGTFFAVIFLGEPLHAYHLAGFALVLGGVMLTSRR